ncbi:Protein ENHANCED DISEASE RESISTANCE 2, C-terminal [Dillenia turbinata]|uniref:Protein ENHANCED DISEASE RESISTANCE 2, C-terminal n=1 Tax=Dillenia turbinata TaxID=194707 RepID=A0AAN8VE89_9MAGN
MNASHVHVDEFITPQLATNVENDRRVLQHSSMLLNSCLACLASTDCSSPTDKRKAFSPTFIRFKRKMALKLSFKRREGETTPPILRSPRTYAQGTIAGSEIPCCPIGKKIANCWSRVELSTFKVQGKNFYRDKKKEMAPNATTFYPFGVEVFLSQREIDHIARFVELPVSNSTEKVPPILIVHIQILLYPAVMFQSEHDGEGMSIVLHFMLSEGYTKDLPPFMQENISKLIDNEVERGNKAEDLPEHLLCCIQLNKIDYTKCHQLVARMNHIVGRACIDNLVRVKSAVMGLMAIHVCWGSSWEMPTSPLVVSDKMIVPNVAGRALSVEFREFSKKKITPIRWRGWENEGDGMDVDDSDAEVEETSER